MALELATRGRLSPNADIISAFGRIINDDYIWREIIYLIFTSEAFQTEVELTSSITQTQSLTSTVYQTCALTSSITSEVALVSSVAQTITMNATIISRYTR